ncbi:uncharacterized protein LOC143150888 [Ptiloglossa arizonensis]|uniref:uncharacterized protein LOC143150888 n=1 Tax=Ptiloglossa arizonensis TaxID=3350558 RepID=UPI003F9F9A8F
MIALLIPFFTATLFDETQWHYGPEFVFDVESNLTTIPLHHDGVHSINYMVMNLFCRPQPPNRLYCHVDNCKQQNTDLTNDNRVDVTENEKNYLCYEGPFEIHFNEYGAEYLVVSERIATANLNDLKLIAERFSIGADLNGLPDGNFDTSENTTIGRCAVNIGINHIPSKETKNKMKRYRYELESLPRLNKVPGESLIIQKTINLNNCSHYAPFYFGTYGKNVVVEPDLNSHLESSSSRIYVSDFQFVSSMSRHGTMGSDKMKNLVVINQYISLSLRDIRPAKQELVSKILVPTKTSIEANSIKMNLGEEVHAE